MASALLRWTGRVFNFCSRARTANADAARAADDCEEAQDTLGYQVRFTDALQTKIDELRVLNSDSHLELQGEIELLEERLKTQTEEVYAGLSPWQLARCSTATGASPTQQWVLRS